MWCQAECEGQDWRVSVAIGRRTFNARRLIDGFVRVETQLTQVVAADHEKAARACREEGGGVVEVCQEIWADPTDIQNPKLREPIAYYNLI